MRGSGMLPTCVLCGAPAREARHVECTRDGEGFGGYSVTLCPSCERRLDAGGRWGHERIAEPLAVCPYCGYADEGSWEHPEGYSEVECLSCGRTFELDVVIEASYSTKRRDRDMPAGYEYLGDDEREALEHAYSDR